ncbi:MAG TPA: hypothetical protein PLK76_04165 [bacterium]|nr:hypothetical protein [bacterium]
MKNPIIRTIYLYLFALVGLAMLVIGLSMIINLGLKTWIFTQADKQDVYKNQPMPLYLSSDVKVAQEVKVCADKCELTQIQKQQVDSWLLEYQKWENEQKNIDTNVWVVRTRQRQAATAVSLILVGLPLWLFHWSVIKKDNKEKEV